MVKETLHLIENKPNLFNFPQSTIDSHKINDAEKEMMISATSLFLQKSQTHVSSKHVKFHIDNKFAFIDVVKMPDYPLVAAFNMNTKKIILNLSALEKRSIANIDHRDLYSIILYAHVCGFLSNKDRIKTEHYHIFCDYMSSLFLKAFAKKYGITGSYATLIPKLRFLVSHYIQRSFFNIDDKKSLIQSAHISKFNMKHIDIDMSHYDFTTINGLISSLSDSQIFPGMTMYKFIDFSVRSFGIINIVIFEDLMRFCSTIFASAVNGNSYFSPSFQVFHHKLYLDIVSLIDSSIPV